MSASSAYIKTPNYSMKPKVPKIRGFVTLLLAVLVAIMGTGILAISANLKKAEALDVPQYVMCDVLPDPAPMLYQMVQSDDMNFMLRSKSVVSAGSSDVEIGLNWILGLFGPGYKEINEDITGQSLDIKAKDDKENEDDDSSDDSGDSGDNEEGDDKKNKNYNKGVKVTPFDRFGVAGMNFTAYNGEWKYIVIDACNPDSDPKDPKAGVYYDDRLEPRSTWDDKDNSKDIRTIQFTKGFGAQFMAAINDVMANAVFTVTKTVVVLTIGVINFAFTDITEAIGMDKLLGDDGGAFSMIFNGIFTPLIVMIFVITAFHIFYLAVVKRQFRTSLGILARSIALFLIAVIVSTNASFWVNIPNKIAIMGQSILITALNTNMTTGDGLCATDIGSKKIKLIDGKKKEADMLEQTSANMRSALGCTFWDTFLMTPWTQGQFGATWNELWAKKKKADWAPSGAKELKNSNGKMVGDAEVPVGDGEVINNWALYQISTQTNVHVPTGHEGEKSKYTSGIANDWWRIVDAVSNYDEETKKETVSGSGEYGSDQEIEYTVPKESSKPTKYWDDWAGNNTWSRVTTALSSLVIASIGTLLPFFFGLMSSVYAFGMVILMLFAPIMLLLGCWSGRGWEIFKGWAEIVLNTLSKRIATGLLLGLSITFIVKIIKMMEDIPWWQGILLLSLITVLLFKVRHKIYDIFASFKFSTTGFNEKASRLNQNLMSKSSTYAKNVGKLATGTVAGGVGAKMAGGNFKGGMKNGMKKEFENLTYRSNSKFLSHARMTKDSFKATQMGADDELFRGSQFCGICGKEIKAEEDHNGTQLFHGGRKADGTIICFECYQDGVDPDASEVIQRRRPQKDEKEDLIDPSLIERNKKIEHKYLHMFTGMSDVNSDRNKHMIEELERDRTIPNDWDRKNQKLEDHPDSIPLTKEERSKKITQLSKFISKDILRYDSSDGSEKPLIPDFLAPWIDDRDLLNAWEDKEYEFIQGMYACAIIMWYNSLADSKETDVTYEKLITSMEKVHKRGKSKKITEEIIESDGTKETKEIIEQPKDRRE